MLEPINSSFAPITGLIKNSRSKNIKDFLGPNSKLDSVNSRGFNFKNSFNPIPTQQPSLYLMASDENYLTLGAELAGGFNRICTQAKNYLTGNSTDVLASSNILLNRNPINLAGNLSLFWPDSATTGANAHWSWGAVSSLSFVHTNTCEFTLYAVIKNLRNETSGTAKYLLANVNNGASDIGFTLQISENDASIVDTTNGRKVLFSISNVGNSIRFGFNEFDNREDLPPAVYSIRVKNINNIAGEVIGAGYINGKYYGDVTINAPLSSTANASNALSIGSLPNATGIFRGFCPEIMICNTMHGDVTHFQIVSYLKDKYGIL